MSIDLIGPLPVAAEEQQYILIAVDQLNKWFKAAYYSSATANVTASFLLCHILSQNGNPHALLSDKSLNFTSHVMTEFSNLFGTYPTFADPYHPVTNGVVEKANGTLIIILQKMASYDPIH